MTFSFPGDGGSQRGLIKTISFFHGTKGLPFESESSHKAVNAVTVVFEIEHDFRKHQGTVDDITPDDRIAATHPLADDSTQVTDKHQDDEHDALALDGLAANRLDDGKRPAETETAQHHHFENMGVVS